jgi:hypothetical protein
LTAQVKSTQLQDPSSILEVGVRAAGVPDGKGSRVFHRMVEGAACPTVSLAEPVDFLLRLSKPGNGVVLGIVAMDGPMVVTNGRFSAS